MSVCDNDEKRSQSESELENKPIAVTLKPSKTAATVVHKTMPRHLDSNTVPASQLLESSKRKRKRASWVQAEKVGRE